MLSIEHYSDLGTLYDISPLKQQGHVTYLVVDTTPIRHQLLNLASVEVGHKARITGR